VPTLTDAKARLEDAKTEETFDPLTTAQKVVNVCEKSWDVYVAAASFNDARSLLANVAADLSKNGAVEMNKNVAESMVMSV
jgi:hypothetical protein